MKVVVQEQEPADDDAIQVYLPESSRAKLLNHNVDIPLSAFHSIVRVSLEESFLLSFTLLEIKF